MKHTILFDLDGTLIDSTPAILLGFETAFLKHDKPMPLKKDITGLIGYPLDIMFARLGVNDKEITSFVKEYKLKYQSVYLEQTILLHKAKESILKAYEFADLGVVTTKTSKFSHILLKHLKVDKYFKTVVGREDVANLKPHPEPILKALKDIGKFNHNAFMIGDTKLDAIAAKDAGINSIGVTCGYGSLQDLQNHCDYVASDSYDAISIILNLS